MNQRIENQLKELKKIAEASRGKQITIASSQPNTADSLSMAIRNKKDAETFMAELAAIARQPK